MTVGELEAILARVTDKDLPVVVWSAGFGADMEKVFRAEMKILGVKNPIEAIPVLFLSEGLEYNDGWTSLHKLEQIK